jgi:hypothetical protein
MGITYVDAMMMWNARRRGAAFGDTLTVGHLRLNLHPSEVKSLRGAHQQHDTGSAPVLEGYQFGDYSDGFFRTVLGASRLSVLDYSAYEGATLIHDLNEPIAADLRNRFDAVVDAGSLEHVFNYPVAMANMMRMAKVGGRVFLKSPANNLCGHGFYQFSPELMFRTFSGDNGFALERVVLVEASYPSFENRPFHAAYEVVDPVAVRTRVGLVSNRPVMMLAEAIKIADVPPFARAPLQSDYVALWKSDAEAPPNGGGTLRTMFNRLPPWLRARVSGHRELQRYSFANTRFYRAFDPSSSGS